MNYLDDTRYAEFSEAERVAFLEGFRRALYLWSWMKDGTSYVGTCGQTYKGVLNSLQDEVDEQNRKDLRSAEGKLWGESEEEDQEEGES